MLFAIFAGCCAHDLPESLGEIAHLLETAVRTDVCDLPIRGLELLRRPLDPVILGVLDGCQADGVVEAAQAFAGADEGGVCDLGHGHLHGEVVLDIAHHDLDALIVPADPAGLGWLLCGQMSGKQGQQVGQGVAYIQLIFRFPGVAAAPGTFDGTDGIPMPGDAPVKAEIGHGGGGGHTLDVFLPEHAVKSSAHQDRIEDQGPLAALLVMTTFYPYQWDLNYRNPRVFNEMMANFLYLANRGIDIIRIDAVPYIWKELGTQCRNLKQVHTIVRMMRMIGEIVCPSVLLLGEVVMEPEKVVPYFGTLEKPECHMLYNVTTMATTWHTVATRDTTLLREQLDKAFALPKEYVFLNYLRCHDDIGWGLDYGSLSRFGIAERSHKAYLNDYFRGRTGADARGELYNEDPVTGDARLCGTTASLCGLQAALESGGEAAIDRAIDAVVMLHGYMFMQSGIPVLYSGDEIGQRNDESYHADPHKAVDSRYLHRGRMDWDAAAQAEVPGTPEHRIFTALAQLERLRASEPAFGCDADATTIDTGDRAILGIVRSLGGEQLLGLFNFSNEEKTANALRSGGIWQDLLMGEDREITGISLPAQGFCWLKRRA